MYKKVAIILVLAYVSYAQHHTASSYSALAPSQVQDRFQHVYTPSQEHQVHHGHSSDSHSVHPKYEFKYGVADSHTGDFHEQHEIRDGDVVHGEYSLREPDGTIRTVKYTADSKNGFRAQVFKSGHSSHPYSVHQKNVNIMVNPYHGLSGFHSGNRHNRN